MDIAILGAGSVGSTLGRRWAGRGHRVIFGVRDPQASKTRALLDAIGKNVTAQTVSEASGAAPVVILATPWAVTEQVLQSAGDLRGKIVVDCTNPLGPDLQRADLGAGAPQVARWASGARVVKAFNTTGSKNMADPILGGDKTTMPLCGDDRQAKETVRQLALDLDFDPIDVGGLDAAAHLESLARLWIHMAYRAGLGPDIAFRVIRRG